MAGKAGRFFCIFIPMVLTMLTLIFLIMIGLGGTNANNNYLSNLYFMKANMTNVTANPDGKIIIQNYYTIALWGYCAGAGDNTTRSSLSFGQKTAATVSFCSARQLQYGFDPQQVWGLTQDTENDLFSDDLNSYINDTYLQTNRKWMSTLFILACVSTGIQMLIGIGGLFSFVGGLFWAISSCCCSGRHHEPSNTGKVMSEPYSYERVDDVPFGATQTINAQRTGSFQAPSYRHGQ